MIRSFVKERLQILARGRMVLIVDDGLQLLRFRLEAGKVMGRAKKDSCDTLHLLVHGAFEIVSLIRTNFLRQQHLVGLRETPRALVVAVLALKQFVVTHGALLVERPRVRSEERNGLTGLRCISLT